MEGPYRATARPSIFLFAPAAGNRSLAARTSLAYNSHMLTQTFSSACRRELDRVTAFIADRDDALNLSAEAARFVHMLVLVGGCRRGVEVGTSYGYSGLWLGAAFQHNGGIVDTIDCDERKTAAARRSFERAGLTDMVISHTGDAAAVLAELDGPFDFVFLDADKANTRRYFDLLWPKLAHRATIVTDNVTSHETELADFVAYLRGHTQLCSMLVSIGSGMELTHKLDPWSATASIDGADWVI